MLAPVIETGWDTVLKEAKSVGIPVIIVDRMVDVTDERMEYPGAAAWRIYAGKRPGSDGRDAGKIRRY